MTKLKEALQWLLNRIVCFAIGHDRIEPLSPNTIKVVLSCSFCRRLIWVHRDGPPTTYKLVRKKDGRGWWDGSAYGPKKKPDSEKPGLEPRVNEATACSGTPAGEPAASPRDALHGSAA